MYVVSPYLKVKPPMEGYEWGVLNEAKGNFELLLVIWTKSDSDLKLMPVPEGHPILKKDSEGKVGCCSAMTRLLGINGSDS